MKSPWSVTALVMAVVAASLMACAKSASGFVDALERAARAAATSTSPSVTISTLTDFPWDKLLVFGPYTPVEQIHDQLGFKWAKATETHIDSSDTFSLLVFVKGAIVVHYFKLPRRVGDFHGLETRNVFTPRDDTIGVKTVGVGDASRLSFSTIKLSGSLPLK